MATKQNDTGTTGTDDANAAWEVWVRGIVADEFSKQNSALEARIEKLESEGLTQSEAHQSLSADLDKRVTALENVKPVGKAPKDASPSTSDGRFARIEQALGIGAEPTERAPAENRKTGNTSIDEKSGAMIASDARTDLKQKVALTSDQMENIDKRSKNTGEALAEVDKDTVDA